MIDAAYARRRNALLAHIGDGIAIIATARERLRSRDSHYPYRYDSDFWYLSGFPEPEAVIVLVGGSAPRAILFCRAKDELREVWDGKRYGPAAAREAFGFDEAWPIEEFEKKLPDLIAERSGGALWYALGADRERDDKIVEALGAVRAQVRSGKEAPAAICDVRVPLEAMRLVKDDDEMAIMRSAAAIAARGHARAMQACRPGIAEYELEAELAYEFRRSGADGHAYSPIVAGGANACVLHYIDNRQYLGKNDLVLIDAGCELAGYASDITRTFPVGGRFSGAQRDAYEIVLAAQAAAISAVKPGAPFIAYHDAALAVLVQGMIDLKLLAGSVEGIIASEAYKRFYMHRTGHWLGLDVHDAGAYKTGGDWRQLEPGMALTVEPGLYIAPADDIPHALQGIGIRIEDDVFVTSEGCEVYTGAPRTIAAIEETMRGG